MGKKIDIVERFSRVRFVWNLHYSCSYRCQYCSFNVEPKKICGDNSPHIPKEKWLSAWEMVYEKYGSVDIHLIGREPCIYPSFVELAAELSKKHYLGLTTNLSVDFTKFAEQIPPERMEFGIGASFHPIFADLNTFLNKVLMLKKKGFTIWINYVAYPPQLRQMKYYKNKFTEQGLPFVVQPYRGVYKKINYPEAYSENEKRLIREVAGKEACVLKDMEYQLVRKVTKDRMCRAGQILAHIEPNGSTRRCGEAYETIGNIFDKDFSLLVEPLPCPVEHCPCDYIYLVEENEVIERKESNGQKAINTEELEVIRDLIVEAEYSLFEHNDLDSAEELVKKGLDRENDNTWALRVLAKVYRLRSESVDLNKKEEYLNLALDNIERALKIDHRDPWVKAEAACILLAQGKLEYASKMINSVLDCEENNEYFQDVKRKVQEAEGILSYGKDNGKTTGRRNIKIALILTPGWGIESPPYSLALLAGILRNRNFKVSVFDVNNLFYHSYNDSDKERQFWNWEESLFWNNYQLVFRFISEHTNLVDDIVDKILSTETDVIGFTVYSTTKFISLELARRIKDKNKNKIIIFGGAECQRKTNWEELINNEFVDAVILDDADESFPEFLEIIQNKGEFRYCAGVVYKIDGKVINCGDHNPTDLNKLPFADFSDFDFNNYKRPDTIKIAFSRGCTERCVYCSARCIWRGFRTMSGERIFEEIKYHVEDYKRRMGQGKNLHIMFLDSLVNANMNVFKEYIGKLAEARKDKNSPLRNFGWSAQVIIRHEMTLEITKLAKEAGCVELNYGIESGSEKVLKEMKKRYTPEIAEKVIRNIYNADIAAKGNFMFGFPTETEEDFQKTMEFLMRNGGYMKQIYPSRTFCALERFSYLDDHREEFGILIPHAGGDNLFWESQKGDNNYLVRLNRYERFCELAASFSHKPLVTGVEDIKRDKWTCFGEYYLFKKEFQLALDCFHKFLELGGTTKYVDKKIELCKRALEKKEKIDLQRVECDKTIVGQVETKEIDLPFSFIFTITTRCNLRCRYCDIWKNENKNGELSAEQWKQAVRKIYNWVGPFELVISGGEAFLKEGLWKIIDLCKELEIKVRISTNGLLIQPYLKEIIDAGLHNLAISLDSLSGFHDWVRNKPDLTKTILQNLDMLLEIKNHPPIEIDTLLMKQNISEIMDILEWTRSKRICFNINPLTENLAKDKLEKQWYKNSILWPDYQEAIVIIDKIIHKKKNGYENICNSISQLEAFKHYYYDPSIKPKGYRCAVGERNFGVGTCGDVHFCPVTGNINSIMQESPANIWFSAQAQDARVKISECNRDCYVLGCYFDSD